MIDIEKEREALRAAIQSFEWKEKDLRWMRQMPDQIARADKLAAHIETMRAMLARAESQGAPSTSADYLRVADEILKNTATYDKDGNRVSPRRPTTTPEAETAHEGVDGVMVNRSDLQDAIHALRKECYVGDTLRNLEAALSASAQPIPQSEE